MRRRGRWRTPSGTARSSVAPSLRIASASSPIWSATPSVARTWSSFLLVLTYFQQVVKIDEHLPALLRSVFQTQADVAHIFLGSRQHLMRQVFTDRNQPLYRSARSLPLGIIPAADFAVFIRERCRASHVAIDQQA